MADQLRKFPIGQRSVPAAAKADGSRGAAEYSTCPRLDLDQLGDGAAGFGDDDLLALSDALKETGEMRLGLVNVYFGHAPRLV